jgi:hypothetical protein
VAQKIWTFKPTGLLNYIGFIIGVRQVSLHGSANENILLDRLALMRHKIKKMITTSGTSHHQ